MLVPVLKLSVSLGMIAGYRLNFGGGTTRFLYMWIMDCVFYISSTVGGHSEVVIPDLSIGTDSKTVLFTSLKQHYNNFAKHGLNFKMMVSIRKYLIKE